MVGAALLFTVMSTRVKLMPQGYTALVGFILLDDPMSWRFFAGALFIIGSGLALNRVTATQ